MSQRCINAVLSGTAAEAVINCVVQNRLTVAAPIYQQVSGQHILPRTVEKGYLSPAVGAGKLNLPCFL